MGLFKFLSSKKMFDGDNDLRKEIFSPKNKEKINILLENLKKVKETNSDVSGLIKYIENNKGGVKDGGRQRKRKRSVKRKRKSMKRKRKSI